MIDHISFAVNDYQKSVEFYDKTLAVLGYTRIIELNIPNMYTIGYGTNKKPSFWIAARGKSEEEVGKARWFHVAFSAPSVEAIHSWYEQCLQLGAVDNGAPGPRPHYHPGYYGAFVIDPNGWRIEACLHNYTP